MSVTQGTLQQTRELLKNEELNREQVETLCRNGQLHGMPDPSGYREDDPYWTKESFILWSETAKRSRGGLVGMSTRSMVSSIATLLGREQKREAEQLKSVGELAQALALGEIGIDEAESRCLSLGISARTLTPTVRAIESRQDLVQQRKRSLEARSEVQRLEAELQLNEAATEAALAPLRAKGRGLSEEKAAAQQIANGLEHAERLLRESIPAPLKEKIREARAAASGPQQLQNYQQGRERQLAQAIASEQIELGKVSQQLTSLVVRTGDFEATKVQEALTAKQSSLQENIDSLQGGLVMLEESMKSASVGQSKAREELRKLESLVFDVWPVV